MKVRNKLCNVLEYDEKQRNEMLKAIQFNLYFYIIKIS